MLVADDDGEGEDCDYDDVNDTDRDEDDHHHYHRFMQKALANVGGCPERRWVGLEPSVRPNCKPMRIIIMMMMKRTEHSIIVDTSGSYLELVE